jgi:DNA-binding response OmpR family regulator
MAMLSSSSSKIEVDPANQLIIQTVVGVGYRLAAE